LLKRLPYALVRALSLPEAFFHKRQSDDGSEL
jgi:hypothetical protein